MNSLPAPPAPSEGRLSPRLLGVLEEYLAQLERGVPPHPDELLARHPDLAEPLQAYLASLELLHQAAVSLHGAAPPREGPDACPAVELGRLGDFRIVAEVGRGGMGVVYEAVQVSLGRRVALKVLPFAAALDAKQLQRFKNEAQAVALLQHPNIVPVYAVGCERGVPYYAMQLIDGQTLAALIRELRPDGPACEASAPAELTQPYAPGAAPGPAPASTVATPRPGPAAPTDRPARDAAFFRTAARLAIQTAQALEHAHQLGMIHRDIKPGNLLVDVRGHLWVTDFGLAHCQSQAGLTLTGDLVGTLRYMSPEQALAKRGAVDHRSDIYSLGATWYELLTAEPAFSGQDRQELLRQIAFEEPQPPRRRDRAIPAELETIVLKAMEKNPAERYATAQELADDLERFLKDEPIRARRPTPLQRARKWARRHRPVVWSAAVAFLVVALVIGASLVRLQWEEAKRWRKETERQEKEVERLRQEARRRDRIGRAVNRALQEAAKWRGEALRAKDKLDLWAKALSAAKRAEGLVAGSQGHADLRDRVRKLLAELRVEEKDRRMLARLMTIQLEQEGGTAIPDYAQAFRTYGIDVKNLSALEAARHIRKTNIAVELAGALDHWAQKLRQRERRKGVRTPTWPRLLAVARAADPDPWRDHLRQALGQRDQEPEKAKKALIRWLASEKKIATLQAPTLDVLGNALVHLGAPDQAQTFLRKAQRQKPGDLWVNYLLAVVLMRLQPPPLDEAIGFFRAALAVRPNSAPLNRNLGAALTNKGAYEEALVVLKNALLINPRDALALSHQGVILATQGDLKGAIAKWRRAVACDSRCTDAATNLGRALATLGDFDGAIDAYRQAIRSNPKSVSPRMGLGWALGEKGDLHGAMAQYRRVIALDPKYAPAHTQLGLAHQAHGEFAASVASLKRAVKWVRKTDPSWAALQKHLRKGERLLALDAKLPAVLGGRHKPASDAEQLEFADLCLCKGFNLASARFYVAVFAADPKAADPRRGGNRYSAACVAALAGTGEGKDVADLDDRERARWRQQALAWLGADLAFWKNHLRANPGTRVAVQGVLLEWCRDRDLAGLRGRAALAKLPEAERRSWRRFWADVNALLKQTWPPKPSSDPTRSGSRGMPPKKR
jgi:serine/threonine protein kinase/Flp pilus assembly protein TadD